MSNSLGPDLVGHFVGPDPGPNCLLKLSTDDKHDSRTRVN